jgi:hypothetical protein
VTRFAGWNKHSQLDETFSAALKHPKLESDRDGHLLILRASLLTLPELDVGYRLVVAELG